GAVLDGAGDADRHVQLRRYGDTGLADLHGVRGPAGVDDRARGTDGRTERVGQLLDEREGAGAADAAAGRDGGRRVGQGWARALLLGDRLDDLGGPGGVGDRPVDRDLLGRTCCWRGRVGIGTDRDDWNTSGDLGPHGDRAAEDLLDRARGVDGDRVG